MRKMLIALTAIIAAIALVACGGGEPGTTDSPGTDDPDVSAASTDPEDLATEISEKYLECMDRMKSILADLPDPEVVKPELVELRDAYINDFVEIGYRVDTHDSTVVDEIGRDVMSQLYGLDSEWLGEASSHYYAVDTEVAGLIGELNIITQYAFFDLLRRQRPDEAERLEL